MTQPRLLLNQRGLTLIELLIAIAIVSVLLTVVKPNLQAMIKKSRITGQINELSATLQYAKFHAIEHRVNTKLCPSADHKNCTLDWDRALILFADSNNNNILDPNETLLKVLNSQAHVNVLKGPNKYIQFYESGMNSSPATLVICPLLTGNASASTSVNNMRFYRALFISLQGRIRISTDNNQDGVHENASGNPLAC